MCETDYSGYPDCRDDTLKALQATLSLGMDHRFVIHTPLMWRDKAATWALAHVLGGDALVELILEETHSCYLGDRAHRHSWGYGCGDCPACELRRRGWEAFAGDRGETPTLGTRPRCDATGQPRARCRQICRRIVPREIRRHPCAVHGFGRGARAALSAQYRQGLGHCGIRDAAAFDGDAHRSRGGPRPAERPHAGNPAADRPQPASGDRSRPVGRAPDQDRLRCIAGGRRHPYSRGHRQLCGASSSFSAVAFGGFVEGAAIARQCRRGLLRRHCRHRRARSRLCRRFRRR